MRLSFGVPLALAPMGYQTLAHPEGELATVRAAGRRGVPVVVSMFAGHNLEDLAAAAGLRSGREPAIRRQLMYDAATTSFEEALGAHLAACDRMLRQASSEASR